MDKLEDAMLSGQKIRQAVANSELEFEGVIRGNSLLLTLGNELQEFVEDTNLIVEPWNELSVNSGYTAARTNWKTYDLLPGRGILVASHEFLRLPEDLAGIIGTLSHLARLGLFAHYASPHIGPRYSGYICLELLNVSGHILRLRPGMPVAKIVLVRTEDTDPQEGSDSIPFYYNTTLGISKGLRSRFFEEFGKESCNGNA
jgi:deoxycytidine triphosphate deaminase